MIARQRKQSLHCTRTVPSIGRARLHARGWWAALLAATITFPLSAATCNLDIQGVSFGNYDFLSSQDLDGVGHVTVTCDVSTSYTIALSQGNGTYAVRLMNSGPHQLAYNLYTDVSHTTVWGDGSSGSTVVNGNGTNVDHAVYGSAAAGQNPYVGSYSDAITVTLTF